MQKITLTGLLALATLAGCAGKNIYEGANLDPHHLQRLWTMPTRVQNIADGERGAEYSNSVLFEQTLIFGATTRGLLSMYVANHDYRWELPIPNGVGGEIALEKGIVYFGGGDGDLYAVHADTGRVQWKYSLRNPVMSKPTIKGGRVFVTTSDDSVYAFDAATGKWLWHYRRRSSQSATIYGASQPLVDGNEVLTGFSDGYFVSLGLDDGVLKWEKKIHQGRKFTDVDARPVLDEGIIYIPSYDGSLYALKRQGGEIIWRVDFGASHAVQIEGSLIYYPSSDGFVYCLQKASGKVEWKFELDGGVPTDLAITDRYILFGSSHRYFYSIEKPTGKLLSRYDVGFGSGFTAAPVYDTERKQLYVLSGGGNLFAFRVGEHPKHIAKH